MSEVDPAGARPFMPRTLRDARFVRMVREKHLDPLGVGWGSSRFVPPPASLPHDARFRALYAAADLTTAFAETVLRDEAVDRPDLHPISEEELTAWTVVNLSVNGLHAVDLTGPHMLAARVSTDAVRATNQNAGQALGREIRDDPRGYDGIVFPSRLTGAENLLVLDRAIPHRLFVLDRRPLLSDARLAVALDDLRVAIL